MTNPLPTQYHFEVYEGSFGNDPSLSLLSSTPFPTVGVGDQFEHRSDGGWLNPPVGAQVFRVTDVKHFVWVVERSHIGHKLMVTVEVVSSDTERVPRR